MLVGRGLWERHCWRARLAGRHPARPQQLTAARRHRDIRSSGQSRLTTFAWLRPLAVAAQDQNQRFLTLDALRGVAAVVVLIIHMGGLPARWLSGGYLAVDFFFVLSGFVLAHAYGERAISFGAFLRARAIRLYPLYFAGTMLGVGAALISGVGLLQITTALACGLFFLPAPGGVDLYPLNPPAWSLFFELVANAAWFPLRRVLRGPVAVTALLIGALAVLGSDIVYGAVSAGGYWSNVAGGFARVLFSFVAGVLTYRFWRGSAARLRLASWLVITGLLAVLALPLPREVFDPVAVLFLMPSLVFAGACCPAGSRIAEWTQRQLGNASYAIYALHFPVIVAVDRLLISDGLLHRLGVTHPSIVTTPLTLALVVGAALLLDKLYDRPVRRLLTSLSARAGALALLSS